jgi:hypothetical protein
VRGREVVRLRRWGAVSLGGRTHAGNARSAAAVCVRGVCLGGRVREGEGQCRAQLEVQLGKGRAAQCWFLPELLLPSCCCAERLPALHASLIPPPTHPSDLGPGLAGAGHTGQRRHVDLLQSGAQAAVPRAPARHALAQVGDQGGWGRAAARHGRGSAHSRRLPPPPLAHSIACLPPVS